VLPTTVVIIEERSVLVATLLPPPLAPTLLDTLADVPVPVTVVPPSGVPPPIPGATLPANSAALWNPIHSELAGTRAVYGMLVISPKLSGGWVYVWTFP